MHSLSTREAFQALISAMKTPRSIRKNGFTLVELLVVIVIIAALAALSLTVGQRMLARGRAAKSIENIRQIAPLLAIYASDHSMKLPPILGPVTQADGTISNLQWNEVCEALLFPNTAPADFKTLKWWKENDVPLKNPLYKANAPPTPGYAMNEMIVRNIEAATGGTSLTDPLAASVPLGSISNSSNTPLIAPFDDFHYRYDNAQIAAFSSGTLKDLLVEGKLPVLFVDGHLEVMTPGQYQSRKLSAMPVPAGQYVAQSSAHAVSPLAVSF